MPRLCLKTLLPHVTKRTQVQIYHTVAVEFAIIQQLFRSKFDVILSCIIIEYCPALISTCELGLSLHQLRRDHHKL
ncbi:hypothetical protein T4D_6636 [Trichinella pseudospiralis]|uniref:Uncharacterized protein n=1 Tax=Trichinella pseudospiralis TaxID=6337 RepID=A0A0V1F5L6_TRIPS|nr:hypothetical protein T4D_6636 [Trichinella pseudospiralis]